LAIQIGGNSQVVAEPLLFYLAFGRRPDAVEPSRRQPLGHAAGLQSITRVGVRNRQGGPASPELRAIEQECRWLSFESGGEDLVEVGFDQEAAGRSADFRPALPLILLW